MNQDQFSQLAWQDVVNNGRPIKKEQDCVCRTLNKLYVLCGYHQRLLEESKDGVEG